MPLLKDTVITTPRLLGMLMKALFLPLLASTLAAGDMEAVPKDWLSVDRPQIDLGVVPQFSSTVAKYKLTNNGPEAVSITSIRSSCACSDLSVENKDLPPGESTYLTAVLDTTSSDTTQRSSKIYLVFSATNREEAHVISLSFKVFVVPSVVFSPFRRSLDFGEFEIGPSPRRRIQLKCLHGDSSVVESIAASADWIQLDLRPAELAQDTMCIDVTLKDEAPLGKIDETIEISFVDTPGAALVFLVKGRKRGRVESIPDNCFITLDQKKRIIVLLRTKDGAPFTLSQPMVLGAQSVEIRKVGQDKADSHEIEVVCPSVEGHVDYSVITLTAVFEEGHSEKIEIPCVSLAKTGV